MFLKTLEREEEGPGGEGRDRAGATERRFETTRGPRPIAAMISSARCLSSIDVLDFDWFDRPDRRALESALRELYVVGAIDARGGDGDGSRDGAGSRGAGARAGDGRAGGGRVPAASPRSRDARRRARIRGGRESCEKAEEAVASAAEKKFGDLVPLLRVFRAWEATEPRPGARSASGTAWADAGWTPRDVRGTSRRRSRERRRDPRPRGDDGDSDPPTTKRVCSSSDAAAAAANAAAFSDVRFCFCVGFANRLARCRATTGSERSVARPRRRRCTPSSARDGGRRHRASPGVGGVRRARRERGVRAAVSASRLRRGPSVGRAARPPDHRIAERREPSGRGGGDASERRIIRIGRRGRRVRRGPPILPRARGETMKRRWRTRGGGTSSESEGGGDGGGSDA